MPDVRAPLDPRPDAPTAPTEGAGATRRTFFKRMVTYIATTTALGSAGVAAALRATGYQVDDRRAGRMKALSRWQLVVVDAVAARICAADVAPDAPHAPPNAQQVEVAEFIDEFVHTAEPAVRRELLALVGCIEHMWPLFCGERQRFTALDVARQDAVLSALETSRYGVARGAFHGLKSLCFMGYYRDPRTWGILGYDGPLVGRPREGWVPADYVVPSSERPAGGAP